MRRNLSWMSLIFLFISLPWNIQTNRQYPYWASTNDFFKSPLCWKLIRFDIIDKKDSFLPVFLHREEACSLKLKSLSIRTPNNFCFELSQIFTSPVHSTLRYSSCKAVWRISKLILIAYEKKLLLQINS